jgi:hypothetical protein
MYQGSGIGELGDQVIRDLVNSERDWELIISINNRSSELENIEISPPRK